MAVIVGVAVAPAGLGGRPVPAGSWAVWGAALIAALVVLRAASGGVAEAARRLGWLLPAVLLFTLPLAAFAAARRDPIVAAALVTRSFTAATCALALVSALGPSGLVAGLRSLRVPRRLVEIAHAMLVGLAAIVRQVSGMLRARAARRVHRSPWSSLIVAPIETLRGFGRLAGALLLRSIERAEALERARSARGGGDA